MIEDAPFHADVAASRVHRWTRGDWQLLPFLLAPARYGLRAINRWKMLDNLRRSLVAPMSLALLLLAPGRLAAVAVGGAGAGAGGVFGRAADGRAGRACRRAATTWPWRHFYRAGPDRPGRAPVRRPVAAGAVAAAGAAGAGRHRARAVPHDRQPPPPAAMDHRRGRAGAGQDHGLPAVLRAALAPSRWWRCCCWSALLCGRHAAPAGWPARCACCGRPRRCGPGGSAGRARRGTSAALPPPDQAYLDGVARDTWRFFERCVGADDSHLPPDNLQTSPHDMVAHRTSPTNIGLYLLSVACARQFGWIGTQRAADRGWRPRWPRCARCSATAATS